MGLQLGGNRQVAERLLQASPDVQAKLVDELIDAIAADPQAFGVADGHSAHDANLSLTLVRNNAATAGQIAVEFARLGG